MSTFGPGTLQIGAVGSEIDISCLVNSCKITPSKDVGDSTTKLCGTVKPGKVTYTYTLNGNLDLDDEAGAAGFFNLCQTAPGTEQPFVFTPDTATETTATGTIVIDPLEFGGEEYGDALASDFEFDMVGPPAYTYADAPAVQAQTRFQRFVANGSGAKAAPVDDTTTDAAASADAEPELVDA